MVMIEMHMHAGENPAVVVMLNIRQLTRQIPHMMVVHERDGAHRFFILVPFLSDQVIPDEVAQRLRSIGVVPSFDMTIECIQQMMIERDAEAHQFFHRFPSDVVTRFSIS